MNTPNKLTLLRIIMVVPFLTLLITSKVLNQDLTYRDMSTTTILFLIAGIIFALAMITDFVDGYLARKNNQVTTFGKLFDPLADKIITTSAMILLSIFGIVPIYFTIIFVLRDIIVDGSRNLAAANKLNVAASWTGKWKTMIQSIGLLLIFLTAPALSKITFSAFNPSWELWALNAPIIIASFLSVVSGWKYFHQIMPLLKLK